MNGRRGVGQTIALFVVLIVVFILMLVFIILSGFLGGVESSYGQSSFESENLLAESLEVDGKELVILEAIVLVNRGDIEERKFTSSFDELVGEGECVLIAHGYEENPVPGNPNSVSSNIFRMKFHGEVSSGNRGNVHNIFQFYKKEGLYSVVSFEDLKVNKKIYVYSYKGECLHVGK